RRTHYWALPAEPELADGQPDPVSAQLWRAVDEADPAALELDPGSTLAEAFPRLSAWRARQESERRVEDWRYRITWRPLTSGTPADPARWLLLVPAVPEDAESTAALASELAAATGAAIQVFVPGEDGSGLAAALREHRPEVLLSLLGLGERSGEGAANPAALDTITVLRTLTETTDVPARLWCITRNAVAVDSTPQGLEPSADAPDPYAAQLWGLGRVAALEHPECWGGLIDLPGIGDGSVAADLVRAVLRGDGEDQLAIRGTQLFGRRLCRAAGPRTAGQVRPRGTAIVTGGTGALGAHLARWLEEIDHLVLVSRRGPEAEGIAELRTELEDRGTRLTVLARDVTDPLAVAELVEQYPPDLVVHAAGAMELTRLAELTAGEYEQVLSAKVVGAENLDAALGDRELDAFVLFSSISGVWGVAEHGAYAAANAHLDALAARRGALGRPALSVAWGPWSGGGMIAESLTEILARRGVPLIDPEPALTGLGRALARGDRQLALAEVDWAAFGPVFTSSRPSPLLDELPEVRAALEPSTVDTEIGQESGSGAFAARVAEAEPEEAKRIVAELVRTELATVLGHPDPAAIDMHRAFSEIGVDSLGAVKLRRALLEATGITMATTIVFDHPTPARLADWLVSRLAGTDSSARATVSDSGSPEEDPVVVVSVGCRFPGEVRSAEDIWEVVHGGVDVLSGFPTDRGWPAGLVDRDPDATGRSTVDRGGFLTGAGEFDAGFFGISPREALAMDPQQRVLLECAWEAIEGGGIDPRSLHGSRTGVYIGMADQDYARLLRGEDTAEAHLATSVANSVASGRIAYVLGLEGPALTLDTACSSSLVALHLAVRGLRAGECERALVGGAMIMSNPDQFIRFSRQRGLAPDGRCKPFAAAADGFALSEGAAVILVERLSVARAEGHRVLGVVRGTAVNSDGASNGLSAPNGLAQQRVIRSALDDAGLAAADIDTVEAHGTGTALGDPIEAGALLEVFGAERTEPLWIGSVKSNLGHTQTAAGLAGLIKTLLAMRHAVLPPTLHVDAPSPHVDWESGAVRLLTEERPWPRGERPRRAGVSSFGISGTNAHVILEEPPREPETAAEPEPVVALPLSARAPEALAAGAGALAEHLETTGNPDATAAGLVRRTGFEERAVVLAGTEHPDVAAHLRALAEGGQPASVVRGSVSAAMADSRGVVFVFPGQGAQWAGMGAELLECSAVFRDRLTECAAAVLAAGGPDVLAVLRSGAELDDVAVVQPVSWAVMVSLAALWESAGIEPAAVLGHSQGEIAAAVVAGALSVAEGARVVVSRALALRAVAGSGAMGSLAESPDAVRKRLAGRDSVVVAAVNGPTSVVISGALGEVEAVLAEAVGDGVRTRLLPVDYASHSPLMEPLAEPITEGLAGIRCAAPRVPWFSTLRSDWITEELDPGYWFANLRGSV
ncbi:type I polyketide synthase, partial [Sciscionella sediminilitoris]|uniref:type I polyketide synthase n=1 Tax=Sciscionella sediminilitoris TaxID=1445613 RepID=UPI0012E0D063